MGGGAIAPPQMIYIVRFVYAGCGVNALSGPQIMQIQNIAGVM